MLTGPAGCGKTATIQILAKELGVEVREWTNPISLDFTKEDLRNMFGHGNYFYFFFSFSFSSSYFCDFFFCILCFLLFYVSVTYEVRSTSM